MVIRLNQHPLIENLRNYPAEAVEKLRLLLASGAQAVPDPHRKDFYELENGTRSFYIHISPVNGKVYLLASWIKEVQPVATAHQAA